MTHSSQQLKPEIQYRYRRNWRGKLVLQVCETKHYSEDLNGSGYFDNWSRQVWRDATISDLNMGVV